MSVYQVGTRVVIAFGLRQGCKGVIQESREEHGVAVVDVLLDGETEPHPFRPSLLVREVLCQSGVR